MAEDDDKNDAGAEEGGGKDEEGEERVVAVLPWISWSQRDLQLLFSRAVAKGNSNNSNNGNYGDGSGRRLGASNGPIQTFLWEDAFLSFVVSMHQSMAKVMVQFTSDSKAKAVLAGITGDNDTGVEGMGGMGAMLTPTAIMMPLVPAATEDFWGGATRSDGNWGAHTGAGMINSEWSLQGGGEGGWGGARQQHSNQSNSGNFGHPSSDPSHGVSPEDRLVLSVGERWCELRHRAVQFVDVLYLGGGYLGGGGHSALCASEMVAAAQVITCFRNVEPGEREAVGGTLDLNGYNSVAL